MVYHCTAYPNMVFTGQVILLVSSHVQRVKCKEKTQGDDVHCTLGNFNHPICKELDSKTGNSTNSI